MHRMLSGSLWSIITLRPTLLARRALATWTGQNSWILWGLTFTLVVTLTSKLCITEQKKTTILARALGSSQVGEVASLRWERRTLRDTTTNMGLWRWPSPSI